MFKRENLVILRNVDKKAYDKLFEAVKEIQSDIEAMGNPVASAEDRAIASVSILDDIEKFSVAFSDASRSYKGHTGKYLSNDIIPGLRYRKVRLELSYMLFKIMRDIYPEKKAVGQ